MIMHVITGIPRAGSTLLCNILAQNPAYKVQHTSPLATFVNGIALTASISPDMQNSYIGDQSMYQRMVSATRAFADEWNTFDTEAELGQTVWDKNRLWTVNTMSLQQLYPEAKTIVLVRDLRDVLASMEKQHRKQPMFDATVDAQYKTVYARSASLMEPDGLVGACVLGVEDIIRRNHKNVIVLAYEEFVYNPEKALALLDDFEYDFENIVNTATDVDALNYDKFPHEGSGKIDKGYVNSWKEFIDPDLADQIRSWYPFYTKSLGY